MYYAKEIKPSDKKPDKKPDNTEIEHTGKFEIRDHFVDMLMLTTEHSFKYADEVAHTLNVAYYPQFKQNDNKITCPLCSGNKEWHDEHKNEYYPCTECNGTGYISKELSEWYKKFYA